MNFLISVFCCSGEITNTFLSKDISPPVCVAVKEIKLNTQKDGDFTAFGWEQEVKALWSMRKLKQKHIVQFITAFRRGQDHHYLILEWADGGNLRNLWKTFPRSSSTAVESESGSKEIIPPTGDLVKATLEQLLGLSEALAAAHNSRKPEKPNESEPRKPEHYRHGDLKPENILWFKDQKGGMGTLKIGDWGLAKQHQIATERRSKHTASGFGTRRYEPPEEKAGGHAGLVVLENPAKKKRSRLYDIWAMGCIALEFIIWLRYGSKELDSFNESIKDVHYDSPPFYQIDLEGKARVHDVVVKWINLMEEDPVFAVKETALGNLLKLIRDRLLVVDLPEGLGMGPDSNAAPILNTPDNPPRPTNVSAITVTSSPPPVTGAPEIQVTGPEPGQSPIPTGAEGGFAQTPHSSSQKVRARADELLKEMKEITLGRDKDNSYWFAGEPSPPPDHLSAQQQIRVTTGLPYRTEDTGGRAAGPRLGQNSGSGLKPTQSTNVAMTQQVSLPRLPNTCTCVN